MKQDTQKTKVLFLMEKPEGDLPCNVFAFFPDLHCYHVSQPDYKVMFTCYAHIGQHSACHIDYANKCLQATQEQYAALKIELEGLGYDLEVLNEQPPAPIKEDAKHTAGEWEFEQCRGNNQYEHIIFSRNGGNSGSYVIAKLGFEKEEKDPAEIKANAALIALCPTLLKENEQLKEQVNVLREALQLLTNSTNLSKLNIRKDFTLINAHANGLKALKKTDTN